MSVSTDLVLEDGVDAQLDVADRKKSLHSYQTARDGRTHRVWQADRATTPDDARTLEADVGLTAQIVRAQVAPVQKLTALLRLAVGEAAPLGPAANRAKAEAVKLMRAPETRAALDAAPDSLATIRGLMQTAGVAA